MTPPAPDTTDAKDPRRTRRTVGLALTTGAALGASVVYAPTASAATFAVTNLNDSGAGSLRDAVDQANATAGEDVVSFTPGLTGTISLTSGQIGVSDGTDIVGPGAGSVTINAGGIGRALYVSGASSAETTVISGLTLTNGDATGSQGGAIYAGGASVVLQSLVVTNSQAEYGGGFATDAMGDLSIISSVFSGNSATDLGGGIYSDDAASFTMRGSTVSGNTSGDGGGGLLLYGLYSPTSTATISDSTVSGNSATGLGGGVELFAGVSLLTVQNSTISGNAAADGGGIGVRDNFYASSVAVVASTIAGNSATGAGGGIANADEPASISNSIVADNTGGDLADLGDTSTAFNLDYSLIETPGTAVFSEVTAGSSLLGVDPQLGALSANGGATRTQVPAATSPVIDRGAALGLTTDQRGLTRPVDLAPVNGAGGAADMGAVEVQAGVVTPPVTTPPASATALAVTKAPKLKGKAFVGKKLKVVAGTYSTPASVSYQWFSGKKAIKKATKASFKVKPKYLGKRLKVVVTAKAGTASVQSSLKAGKVKVKPAKKRR